MIETYLSIEEQEKKRKKKLDEINKELQKHNELLTHLSENLFNLNELQNMIKEWVITINDKQLFERIARDGILEDNELDNLLKDIQTNDLLKKIEEIEKDLDIDDILPQAMRIKKNEFLAACTDPAKKDEIIQKIDDGINYVMFHIWPTFKTGSNPFARRIKTISNLLFLANKKAIRVQEHMIDLKQYLRSKK